MSLAGFNRTRRRLAEEHKKRLEAQKVIKKPVKKDKIIKVTADTDIEKATKELKEMPFNDYEPSKEEQEIIEKNIEGVKTEIELENLTDITEEVKEKLVPSKPKKKSKKG